jgi:hypothetical protein
MGLFVDCSIFFAPLSGVLVLVELIGEPSPACGTSSADSLTSSSRTNAPTTSVRVAMIQNDRKPL